jgi:acetyl esterase/lipase
MGVLIVLLPLVACAAEQTEQIPLWPNGAPGFEARKDEPERAESYWVKNIHQPSLTVYRPAADKATGTAVVICPGGGHRELVYRAEGCEPAEYLSRLGVAAFVLKYRLAREPNSPYDLKLHPRQDAQRALRLIRSRAAEWKIDPARVGMLGFSAGGEVVSMVAYEPGAGPADAPDSIDRLNGRPDFQMLVYPGPLGVPETIPQDAPPAFLLVANDDGAAGVIVNVLQKYRAARRPVEAHVLAAGGHGFNMGNRSKLVSVNTWPQRMADWLKDNALLDPPKQAPKETKAELQPGAEPAQRADAFRQDVAPVLAKYCYDCHGNGTVTAQVAFDQFTSDSQLLEGRELWWKALKQLRAGLMPPQGEPRPSRDELARIESWVKAAVFEIDPQNPDPGRVTVRRLNRVEYRNTIRDLLDVNYDTPSEFPADDTGYGFDNIGDVLTVSPLLLEKYLAAAETIVKQAVPSVSGVPPEKTVPGREFRRAGETESVEPRGDLYLSYYAPATVSATYAAEHAGAYQVDVRVSAHEKFVDGVFDYNKCRLLFKADGQELLRKELSRQEGKSFSFSYDREWTAGNHELTFEVEPLTPDEKQTRSLSVKIDRVTIRGPLGAEHQVRPAGYERFFPRDVPATEAERRQYAGEILARFAARAFRRPPDAETVERLVNLAQGVAEQQGFEAGVARAFTAILSSPRFLFREEMSQPAAPPTHPLIDEYSLATRLSYFLWSTMPDEELFRLAGEQKLRENLAAQVARMLGDPRSKEFVRQFTGQWLQARDIDSININAFAVITGDQPFDPEAQKRRARFRELRSRPLESLTAEEKAELDAGLAMFRAGRARFRQFDLDGELRRAMRAETEMLFTHLVREDRSLLELIDCNYTFLNERLARHYGIEGVQGSEMRLVELPPDSPRGGILTQGTILAITSNPDRTSPVKRGLFILDNLLGTPPPPPPPDIPALEDAAKQLGGRPSLRQQLELHRSQALCNSCHNRLDPLGLALEDFNALGMLRENRPDRPIDTSGTLLTGESFTTIRELKHILVTERRRDFYRCLTEKLLTYALGRGLDYYDVYTVDDLVERLDQGGGRASILISGIIQSVPFQRSRGLGLVARSQP